MPSPKRKEAVVIDGGGYSGHYIRLLQEAANELAERDAVAAKIEKTRGGRKPFTLRVDRGHLSTTSLTDLAFAALPATRADAKTIGAIAEEIGRDRRTTSRALVDLLKKTKHVARDWRAFTGDDRRGKLPAGWHWWRVVDDEAHS
jgi:hypothetical protein